MVGLVFTAFASSGIAWIKQIQQKHLYEVQIQQVIIEAISRNSSLNSLQKAREQTIISLKQLDQVPIIPWIADPSKTIQAERHHLSSIIKQIDQKIAIIDEKKLHIVENQDQLNFKNKYNFEQILLQYNNNRQEWEKIN